MLHPDAPPQLQTPRTQMHTSLPLILTLTLLTTALAHGSHDTDLSFEPVPEGLTWEQWHMKQEHGVDEYDAEYFFRLHDMKSKGFMDRNDILMTYGLYRDEVIGKGDGMGTHDDSEVISEKTKQDLVDAVLKLMDADSDKRVTKEEYLKFAEAGGQFPDLEVGVGHHGDFEHEYEVHHWNKFHRDNDPDVKIVHKEDIEHELLHHEHEIEHEQNVPGLAKFTLEQFEKQIKLDKIPSKFRA